MPRGRRTALRPQLTQREHEVLALTQQVRSSTITPQLRQRGRLILLLAKGATITDVARHLGLSRKCAYKWIERWHTDGLAGLVDRREGRPLGRRNQYTLRQREDT